MHIEPFEPYKHHSLEYTSDVCYDPARSLTGAGFWGGGDHTLGLTPVCVGKDER